MKKFALWLLVILLCLSMTACGTPKTTSSAEGYIGTDYEGVVAELEEAGFTNIELQEVQDLTSASDMQDGDVGAISIDGVTDFEEGTKFEADVPIIITYHTIPKLPIPISSDDLQDYDYETIADMFSEGGFPNVSVEVVYDIDPTLGIEFENEVEINYLSFFAEGEEVPFDAQVTVTCHRPYELFTLKLHVNFSANLLFNRYDVTLEVGDYEETLEHGTDGDFEFVLKEGEYTLAFVSEESSSVKGEVTFYVDCDIDSSYKISCGGNEITVTEEYIDRKQELAEDEVKVLTDETEFWFENYEDVIKILKEWGFTNIKEVPMYDIYLGWTDEGEVDDVTIDNSDDYKRGDVFKKDVEVVVSYHMPYEDDPALATEPTEAPVPSETETVESEYELAFVRELPSYSLYYMFDTDTKTVVQIGTDDTYLYRGTYAGDFSTGVTMTWDHGEWTDELTYTEGAYTAIYTDGYGVDWEYSVADIATAQRLLNERER